MVCFHAFQLAFKMFLGVSPVVTNWSAASDEFSLILDNNPLSDFVELPDGREGLFYSNILCGALRGALEMVRISASELPYQPVCAVTHYQGSYLQVI